LLTGLQRTIVKDLVDLGTLLNGSGHTFRKEKSKRKKKKEKKGRWVEDGTIVIVPQQCALLCDVVCACS
jgi:hypothetical protein